MKYQDASLQTWIARLFGLAVLLGAPLLQAQFAAEQSAAMGMADTLNGASGGPSTGGSFDPIGRAKGAAGAAGTHTATATGAMTPTTPPPNIPPNMRPPAPGPAPNAPSVPGVVATAGAAVAAAIPTDGPVVITGLRVFDAITHELLDDPYEKRVSAAEKENYFDDGTHGDVEANDGKFTNVQMVPDESVGQSHQRVKERLIGALSAAEQLDPLQFFGFNLMSTDQLAAAPRNRAWTMEADPSGGPGMVVTEKPVEKPVSVPKYREWEHRKDITYIRSDWAKYYLMEYRKNKDNLTSEFYPMYIPMPPRPPLTAPPVDFEPFSDPESLSKFQQTQMQQMQQQMGGGMIENRMMGGGAMGNGYY